MAYCKKFISGIKDINFIGPAAEILRNSLIAFAYQSLQKEKQSILDGLSELPPNIPDNDFANKQLELYKGSQRKSISQIQEGMTALIQECGSSYTINAEPVIPDLPTFIKSLALNFRDVKHLAYTLSDAPPAIKKLQTQLYAEVLSKLPQSAQEVQLKTLSLSNIQDMITEAIKLHDSNPEDVLLRNQCQRLVKMGFYEIVQCECDSVSTEESLEKYKKYQQFISLLHSKLIDVNQSAIIDNLSNYKATNKKSIEDLLAKVEEKLHIGKKSDWTSQEKIDALKARKNLFHALRFGQEDRREYAKKTQDNLTRDLFWARNIRDIELFTKSGISDDVYEGIAQRKFLGVSLDFEVPFTGSLIIKSTTKIEKVSEAEKRLATVIMAVTKRCKEHKPTPIPLGNKTTVDRVQGAVEATQKLMQEVLNKQFTEPTVKVGNQSITVNFYYSTVDAEELCTRILKQGGFGYDIGTLLGKLRGVATHILDMESVSLTGSSITDIQRQLKERTDITPKARQAYEAQLMSITAKVAETSKLSSLKLDNSEEILLRKLLELKELHHLNPISGVTDTPVLLIAFSFLSNNDCVAAVKIKDLDNAVNAAYKALASTKIISADKRIEDIIAKSRDIFTSAQQRLDASGKLDAAFKLPSADEVAKEIEKIFLAEYHAMAFTLNLTVKETQRMDNEIKGMAAEMAHLYERTRKGKSAIKNSEQDAYFSIVKQIADKIHPTDMNTVQFKVKHSVSGIQTVHIFDAKGNPVASVSIDIGGVKLPYSLVKPADGEFILSYGGTRGVIAPFAGFDEAYAGEGHTKGRLFTHSRLLGVGQYGSVKEVENLLSGLNQVIKKGYVPNEEILLRKLLELRELHRLSPIPGITDTQVLLTAFTFLSENDYAAAVKVRDLDIAINATYKVLASIEIKTTDKRVKDIIAKSRTVFASAKEQLNASEKLDAVFKSSSSEVAKEIATILLAEYHPTGSALNLPSEKMKQRSREIKGMADDMARLHERLSKGKSAIEDLEQKAYLSIVKKIAGIIKPIDISTVQFKVMHSVSGSQTVHVFDAKGMPLKPIAIDLGEVTLPYSLVKPAHGEFILSFGGTRGVIAPFEVLNEVYGVPNKDRLFTQSRLLNIGEYGSVEKVENLLSDLNQKFYKGKVPNKTPTATPTFKDESRNELRTRPITARDDPLYRIESDVLQNLSKAEQEEYGFISGGTQYWIENDKERTAGKLFSQTGVPQQYHILTERAKGDTYADTANKQLNLYTKDNIAYHDPLKRPQVDETEEIKFLKRSLDLSIEIVSEALRFVILHFSHNDIKPENFLYKIDPDGSYQVKFIDWATGGFERVYKGPKETTPEEAFAELFGPDLPFIIKENKYKENKYCDSSGRYVIKTKAGIRYGIDPTLQILHGARNGTLPYISPKVLGDERDAIPISGSVVKPELNTVLEKDESYMDDWALTAMTFGVCNRHAYFTLVKGRAVTDYVVPGILDVDGETPLGLKIVDIDKFNQYFACGQDLVTEERELYSQKNAVMYIPSNQREGEPLHLYRRLQQILEKLHEKSVAAESSEQKIIKEIDTILTSVRNVIGSGLGFNKAQLKETLIAAQQCIKNYEKLNDQEHLQALAQGEALQEIFTAHDQNPLKPDELLTKVGKLSYMEILCTFPSNKEQVNKAITILEHAINESQLNDKFIGRGTIFRSLFATCITKGQNQIVNHLFSKIEHVNSAFIAQIQADGLLHYAAEQGMIDVFSSLITALKKAGATEGDVFKLMMNEYGPNNKLIEELTKDQETLRSELDLEKKSGLLVQSELEQTKSTLDKANELLTELSLQALELKEDYDKSVKELSENKSENAELLQQKGIEYETSLKELRPKLKEVHDSQKDLTEKLAFEGEQLKESQLKVQGLFKQIPALEQRSKKLEDELNTKKKNAAFLRDQLGQQRTLLEKAQNESQEHFDNLVVLCKTHEELQRNVSTLRKKSGGLFEQISTFELRVEELTNAHEALKNDLDLEKKSGFLIQSELEKTKDALKTASELSTHLHLQVFQLKKEYGQAVRELNENRTENAATLKQKDIEYERALEALRFQLKGANTTEKDLIEKLVRDGGRLKTSQLKAQDLLTQIPTLEQCSEKLAEDLKTRKQETTSLYDQLSQQRPLLEKAQKESQEHFENLVALRKIHEELQRDVSTLRKKNGELSEQISPFESRVYVRWSTNCFHIAIRNNNQEQLTVILDLLPKGHDNDEIIQKALHLCAVLGNTGLYNQIIKKYNELNKSLEEQITSEKVVTMSFSPDNTSPYHLFLSDENTSKAILFTELKNNLSVAKEFLLTPPVTAAYPLLIAAQNGNYFGVKNLVDLGTDIKLSDAEFSQFFSQHDEYGKNLFNYILEQGQFSVLDEMLTHIKSKCSNPEKLLVHLLSNPHPVNSLRNFLTPEGNESQQFKILNQFFDEISPDFKNLELQKARVITLLVNEKWLLDKADNPNSHKALKDLLLYNDKLSTDLKMGLFKKLAADAPPASPAKIFYNDLLIQVTPENLETAEAVAVDLPIALLQEVAVQRNDLSFIMRAFEPRLQELVLAQQELRHELEQEQSASSLIRLELSSATKKFESTKELSALLETQVEELIEKHQKEMKLLEQGKEHNAELLRLAEINYNAALDTLRLELTEAKTGQDLLKKSLKEQDLQLIEHRLKVAELEKQVEVLKDEGSILSEKLKEEGNVSTKFRISLEGQVELLNQTKEEAKRVSDSFNLLDKEHKELQEVAQTLGETNRELLEQVSTFERRVEELTNAQEELRRQLEEEKKSGLLVQFELKQTKTQLETTNELSTKLSLQALQLKKDYDESVRELTENKVTNSEELEKKRIEYEGALEKLRVQLKEANVSQKDLTEKLESEGERLKESQLKVQELLTQIPSLEQRSKKLAEDLNTEKQETSSLRDQLSTQGELLGKAKDESGKHLSSLKSLNTKYEFLQSQNKDLGLRNEKLLYSVGVYEKELQNKDTELRRLRRAEVEQQSLLFKKDKELLRFKDDLKEIAQDKAVLALGQIISKSTDIETLEKIALAEEKKDLLDAKLDPDLIDPLYEPGAIYEVADFAVERLKVLKSKTHSRRKLEEEHTEEDTEEGSKENTETHTKNESTEIDPHLDFLLKEISKSKDYELLQLIAEAKDKKDLLKAKTTFSQLNLKHLKALPDVKENISVIVKAAAMRLLKLDEQRFNQKTSILQTKEQWLELKKSHDKQIENILEKIDPLGEVRDNLVSLNTVPMVWINPAFQGSAKQYALELEAQFKTMSEVCDELVPYLDRQRCEINELLNALPSNTELEWIIYESEVEDYRTSLSEYLRTIEEELLLQRSLQQLFQGNEERKNPLTHHGMLTIIKQAKEEQKGLRQKTSVYEITSVDHPLGNKSSYLEKISAGQAVQPGQETSIEIYESEVPLPYQTTNRVKPECFREHTVSANNHIVGRFIEERIPGEKVKLTVATFPAATDPNARVAYSIAMVTQLLLSLKEPPSASNPVIMNGGSKEELQCVWTALMIIGAQSPYMKFAQEAINVTSTDFKPAEEIIADSKEFSADSCYKKTFEHCLQLKAMLGDVNKLVQDKFGHREEHAKVSKDSVQVATFFNHKMKPALDRIKQDNIEDRNTPSI